MREGKLLNEKIVKEKERFRKSERQMNEANCVYVHT